MNEIKLCKDCANFIASNETCAAAPMPVDFVYGRKRGYYLAQLNRESISGCSKDALNFREIKVAA